MPQVMKEWGLTPVMAGSIASYGFAGLMVGAAGFGMIADRIGRKGGLMLALMFFSLFSGGFAVLLFGTVTSTASLYVMGGLASMLIIGAQIGIQVVAGEAYPTHIRTTGAGWVMTVGRLGAILAGVLGGFLLQLGFTFQQFFIFYAIPCFIVAGIALLFKVNRSDTLEAIHLKFSTSYDRPVIGRPQTLPVDVECD